MKRPLKITLLSLLIITGLFVGGFVSLKASSFGQLPSPEELTRFQQSPQFDADKKIFVNRRPLVLEEMRKRSMNASSLLQFFFGGSKDKKPSSLLPVQTPDFTAFQQPAQDLKLIWFGHSSVLLSFDGKMILIDPVLSNSTGPFGWMMKRFRPSVTLPAELPKIDLILLTHDHYDHLDEATIRAFVNTETRFVAPLGVAAHLTYWGIERERIEELDWWQQSSFEGVKITATPAQHFSGRGLKNQNQSLWASYVLQGAQQNIFFSGDSGYDTHFKDIGEKLGPFDLAFIENGQYNERWREVHLLPEESVQAFHDLKAKKLFPIHWGMFTLSIHSWYEPAELMAESALKENISLVTPLMGETVILNDQYSSQQWWKNVPPR